MITFNEWVTKFHNEINASTGGYWKPSETAAASGTPQPTIEEWLKWANRVNYEFVLVNNFPMTDAQLAAQWDREHPPVRTVTTPFGNYTVPLKPPGTPGRNPLDMTVRELLDTIEQLSK